MSEPPQAMVGGHLRAFSRISPTCRPLPDRIFPKMFCFVDSGARERTGTPHALASSERRSFMMGVSVSAFAEFIK
jgi:hypothetical protein